MESVQTKNSAFFVEWIPNNVQVAHWYVSPLPNDQSASQGLGEVGQTADIYSKRTNLPIVTFLPKEPRWLRRSLGIRLRSKSCSNVWEINFRLCLGGRRSCIGILEKGEYPLSIPASLWIGSEMWLKENTHTDGNSSRFPLPPRPLASYVLPPSAPFFNAVLPIFATV